MIKKTKGFVKCKDCGKVKKYSSDRFPVEVFNNDGEFIGYVCYDCTHKDRTKVTKNWGNVEFGKGRKKNLLDIKEMKEFFGED